MAMGATTAVVPPVGLTLIAVGAGICVTGYLVRHPEWCRRRPAGWGRRRSILAWRAQTAPVRVGLPFGCGRPGTVAGRLDPPLPGSGRDGVDGHGYDQGRMPTIARNERLDAQLKELPDSPGV